MNLMREQIKDQDFIPQQNLSWPSKPITKVQFMKNHMKKRPAK